MRIVVTNTQVWQTKLKRVEVVKKRLVLTHLFIGRAEDNGVAEMTYARAFELYGNHC